jgi:hypothetical protein
VENIVEDPPGNSSAYAETRLSRQKETRRGAQVDCFVRKADSAAETKRIVRTIKQSTTA